MYTWKKRQGDARLGETCGKPTNRKVKQIVSRLPVRSLEWNILLKRQKEKF